MLRPRRLAALGLVLVLLLPGLAAAPVPTPEATDLGRLTQVLALIRENYAGDVDTDRIESGAVRGVMEQLDSHSRYFDSEEFEELRSGTSGGYDGIGVGLGRRGEHAIVLSVQPGSPAARAELRPGDRLLTIDGVSVEEKDLTEIARLLRGTSGSRVLIGIEPEARGSAAREVAVVRAPVIVPSVGGAVLLDRGVAYVRIDYFSEQTGREFARALEAVSAEKPRALLLDLRGNPGGVLTQAVDVAERFVPRGKLIVTTEGRQPAQDRLYFSNAPPPRLAIPVAILVDGGTASAAEVVTGALQDWDLALVVGETTYGKGSVQTILPLEGGGGIKLTTARYYTPSGRSFDRPAELAKNEPQASRDAESWVAGASWALRGPGEEAPASGRQTHAPLFITASGRSVKGGGGIDPDVVMSAPKAPALVAALERECFFTTFVHDVPQAAGDRLARFKEYVEADRGRVSAQEWNAAAREIAWRLQREEIRMNSGDEAAERFALGHDPVCQRAATLVASGRNLSELLHQEEPAR